MKTRLSSRLTYIYKFVFPTFWTLSVVVLMTLVLIDSNYNPLSFLMLLVIWPMIALIRLKKITYDESHLYVSDWRTTETYEWRNVKAINEGRMISFDPFFEIEILEKGHVKKVEFLPRLREMLEFSLFEEYTGYLQEFKARVRWGRLA